MAHTVTSKNASGEVYCIDGYVSGYFNLTTALTRFQFKMNTGNIDSGTNNKIIWSKLMGLISNGTTIFDAGTMSVGGSMTHIKTITVSSPTDNVQFVHGSSGVVLDSTYKEYIFYLVDMHHNSNSEPEITFNFSIDSGSNYNVTKTSTSFRAYHGKMVVVVH